MADSDYKNGAVSIISAIGSAMAALGFEVQDNLEAAKTMLKMQGDVVSDPTMKSYITGEYSVKTLYDGVNKIWALSGHFISWVQKWLAKNGAYDGNVDYNADILFVDNQAVTYKNIVKGNTVIDYYPSEVQPILDHYGITGQFLYYVHRNYGAEPDWYQTVVVPLIDDNSIDIRLSTVRMSNKANIGWGITRSDKAFPEYIHTHTSTDKFDEYHVTRTNQYVWRITENNGFYINYDSDNTLGHTIGSTVYKTGGGISRGGGVGRHSLPKDENFPPCGGPTTVPAITEWSGRVINWKGDCYMPLTYYKVNPSNENPGTQPGEPNTPVDPDNPNFDPSDILKYTYPNETPQTIPQNGTNTDQSTGQLVNNLTNATNGPSDIPSTGVKSGLFTLWHPSSDDLQNLGAFLYGATAQGTIASIIGNPINAIIQLTEWAVTPVDGPEKSPVICNIAATDLKMPTIPNQFMQFDCGSITIPREYSDFRDYEPYTRLSLFLPFVGEVNISTNDCILPHSIKVIYNLDFLSGAACAEVLVDGDVRYAYQAAMCAAIPVTSSDASRLLASLIGAAVGTVGGGVMGGIVGGTAGSRMIAHSLIGGVSGAAMSPINGIQIQRTGSISANTGLLGEMKPYVLVTRPISYIPDSYESLIGRPYQTTASLGSQTGFVKVREVHLDGITATEVEKEEIESLLKKGVII